MTNATNPELPFGGRLRLRIAIALCTVFGCAEAPPAHEDVSPLASPDAPSSTAQALSDDPGPKNLFVGGYLSSLSGQTYSDGTHVYVHYYRDADRHCWGNVLRMPVGGGAVTYAMAPCGTRDFAILNGSAYFAVVRIDSQYSQQGIYHQPFSVDGGTSRTNSTFVYSPVLTTSDALAIATDGHHLYWNDTAAALHRVLPDGTGDVILAPNATVTGEQALIVDDSSVYGYDGAELWRVPKGGGGKTTLATLSAPVSALQLDSGELFWIESGARIQRLPVTGGTPSTFHETATEGEPWRYPFGFHGLAVAQGWVYWAVDGNLERRSKTGGAVEAIDTAEPGAVVLGADATNVYYARQPMVAPGTVVTLRRLPIADLVAPFCDHTPRRLVDAAAPRGLAAAGSWVYFTEADQVRRVWKNGGSLETVKDISQPGARALHTHADGLVGLAWVSDEGVNSYRFGSGLVAAAADAKDVFFGGMDADPYTGVLVARLYYIDGTRLVGPADTTLVIGLAPYRLVGDESWLYWTDRGDQTVNRVPRAGGSVEVLAQLTSGEIGDLELDLDTDEIIFGVDDGDTGRILRVPTAGGAVALVAEGAFSPLALEAAGPSVYFSSQGPDAGTVYRVATRGGTPAVLVEGGVVGELDTLGGCVFYATDTGIDVVSGVECDAATCVSGDDICIDGGAPDAGVTPADAGGTNTVDAGGTSPVDGGGTSPVDGGGTSPVDAGGDAEGAPDAGGGADQGARGGGGGDEGTPDGGGARDGGLSGGDRDGDHRWGCGVIGMRQSHGFEALGSGLFFLLLRLRRRHRSRDAS